MQLDLLGQRCKALVAVSVNVHVKMLMSPRSVQVELNVRIVLETLDRIQRTDVWT